MIFYEAPHKLAATLKDMYNMFGNRKISIIRELTKVHEEVIRTTLEQAAQLYAENEPKGEFVLVIEGAKREEEKEITLEYAVELARELAQKGMSLSECAKEAAKLTGFKKGDIYKQLI